MKIKLNNQGDIWILQITEDVDIHHAEVIRAGITNLLQHGKNKIVLDLSAIKSLSPEVALPLIKLHGVAAELKGSIVVVGHTSAFSAAMKVESKLPPIKCYPTIEAAHQSFKSLEPQERKAAPRDPFAIPKGIDPAKLSEDMKALASENKQLEDKLKASGFNEIQKLLAENGELEFQLKMLKEILKLFKIHVKKIKGPSSSAQKAYQELLSNVLKVTPP